MRRSNVRIIGIPEGVERERRLEGIFEQMIAENSPNLGKETAFVSKRQRRPLPKSIKIDQHPNM